MITEKEERYIRQAGRGAKRSAYAMLILTISLTFLGDGSFLFLHINLSSRLDIISLIGVNASLFLMFLVVIKAFLVEKVDTDIDGIHIPATKELDYDVIKYRWIDQIIMNDRTNCDAYSMVLFTDDKGKKYAYHLRQGGLDDPVDLAVEMRKKGIYVRFLKPSCWWQKNIDIYWISELIQGRKMIFQ